ncbi:MAG: MFS transporter [Actinomycetota bacterium]
MTTRPYDPARVFVRAFGTAEGIEWGFWLAATVWWVVELDLGPLELVVMGAVLQLSVLVSETPTGVVADLMSRRRSVIIAQFVMGLSFIWAVISREYWVILPAQAVFGIGWTFRSGADTAWVTDELKGMGAADDDDIEKLLIRKHRFSFGVGLVSLFVSMVVGTVADVRVAAIVMGVASLSVAVGMVATMSEDHFTPGRDRQRGFAETLRQGATVVRTRPRLRVLVGVVLMLDMGAEALDRLGHKFFIDEGGFDDDSLFGVWVLYTVIAFAGLAVNALSGRALDRGFGVARLATILIFVAAVGAVLTASTTVLVVIGIGLMLQDATRESLWPVLEGWANRDAPSEVRATVHSLMGQVSASGELVGGLLLAVIAEATSIRLVLFIAAGMWAVSTVLATRGIDRERGSVVRAE